jgi:methyl-accepting chemotaxis protein
VLEARGFAQALETQVTAGKLTHEQALSQLREQLHSVRFGGADDYLLVQTYSGLVVIHGGDPQREGKPTTAKDSQGRSSAELANAALRNSDGGVITYEVAKPGQTEHLPKISYVARFAPWEVDFIAGAWTDDIDAAFRSTIWKLSLLGGCILLVTVLACLSVSIDISRSLGRLKIAMQRLAGGDLGIEVSGIDRRDEVGQMAAAVQVFKDTAVEIERMKVEQQAAEKRASEEKRNAMHQMASDFEAGVGDMVRTVSSAATQMENTAASMSATAEQSSQQAIAVASASDKASTNVQSVASAVEELSCSISEISRQVTSSSAVAVKAVSEAEHTNALMASLAEAARQIGAVTDMISEIASKTNLLALNATIEAARAGDAGKGFAVVASEVKSLANQTAHATHDISTQIAAMQSATTETVAAIQAISATINQLSEIATTIASAVEEQNAATQEIARNVEQAAAGTSAVSVNIAGVTQAVSATGAAAEQVLGAAGELSKQGEALRDQVDRFLSVVRAS